MASEWQRAQQGDLSEEAERQAVEQAGEAERRELHDRLSQVKDYGAEASGEPGDPSTREETPEVDKERHEQVEGTDRTREQVSTRELQAELERRGDYGGEQEPAEVRKAKAEAIDAKLARDFPEAREKLGRTRGVEYLGDEDFDKVRRAHGVALKEGQELCGFHDRQEGRTFVRENLAMSDELRTSFHERLHSISPEAQRNLPEALYEGMTEHIAARESGPWGELRDIKVSFQEVGGGREMVVLSRRPGEAYPEEAKLVSMIESAAGKDAVEKAYFDGDLGLLREKVDQSLGRGSFDEIVRHVEHGRVKEAQELILQKWAKVSDRFR